MARQPFIKIMIINCLLMQDGMTGYDIIKYCRGCGILASSGTVYPHLKSLEDARVIACREEGRRKIYRLTPRGRTEMNGSGLVNAPEFLKNAYFKSMSLASTLDWSKRAEVQTLVDNVEEIKRYLVEYINSLK